MGYCRAYLAASREYDADEAVLEEEMTATVPRLLAIDSTHRECPTTRDVASIAEEVCRAAQCNALMAGAYRGRTVDQQTPS